jgi:phage terminase large subunit
MKLSPLQKVISDCESRFRVAVCGRRFGKSFLAINEIAKFARYPNRNVWYVAPTYRMTKQIILDPLKAELQKVRWIKKINESDLTITLVNGSKISLRSADNPDSLRGSSLDAVIMDEFAFIKEKVWAESLRPALSDRQGHALFITTPVGTQNWAYDMYMRGLDPAEQQWSSFQYTTLQGGYVTADEIVQAKQDLDIRTFNQEYCATFESYANRIFYAFDRNENIRPFKETTPSLIYAGLDFNVGQMSCTLFARNGDVVHAFDEISLLSSNTDEVIREIRNRYPTQRIQVYPDPAGNQRRSSAAGATDISILRNAGFTVKVPNSHNPVRDGINAVNSKLCNADGRRTFFVDPKCKKTIESLEKHSYKEGSSIPDKDSGFDHFSDSIRYYIDYDFPVRRNVEPQQPQRWGVALA